MATKNIVPRADQEGGLGTAAKGWGKLFINQAASQSTPAFTLENSTVGQIAVDINALNTTANVLDITAGALNGGASIYLNSLNGQNDLKLVSSAAAADYFTIATGADGATTLTTVDGTAADAKLTLTADGELEQNCVAWDINASGIATINATSLVVAGSLDSSITVAGSNKDLDISVTGGSTQKLTLASAGTGVDAIALTASAGGIKLAGDIHVEDLTPTLSVITNTDFTAVDKYEYVITDANGGSIVLPAAAAGSRINFTWGVTQTGDVTITAATGDILNGYAIINSMTDTSSAAVYFAPDGSDLIITLNGGTTGGFIGDTIELVGISAEEWRVRAKLSSTTISGNLVNPFS